MFRLLVRTSIPVQGAGTELDEPQAAFGAPTTLTESLPNALNRVSRDVWIRRNHPACASLGPFGLTVTCDRTAEGKLRQVATISDGFPPTAQVEGVGWQLRDSSGIVVAEGPTGRRGQFLLSAPPLTQGAPEECFRLSFFHWPRAEALNAVVLPPYFEDRFREFHSEGFPKALEDLSAVTRIPFDDTKPPFVFAGDLQSDEFFLSFGLNPRSPSELDLPHEEREHFAWRSGYFDCPKLPHPMHGWFGHVFWGAFDVTPPPESARSQWLHEHGYVAFDLFPFYSGAAAWRKSTNWDDPGLLEFVEGHLNGCLGLVSGKRVKLAVFSGKPWEELLVEEGKRRAPPAARATSERLWRHFEVQETLSLDDVTGKGSGQQAKVNIYLGRFLRNGQPSFPAVLIAWLIHRMPGSHQACAALGRRARSRLRL